jgi:hypothetical protein
MCRAKESESVDLTTSTDEDKHNLPLNRTNRITFSNDKELVAARFLRHSSFPHESFLQTSWRNFWKGEGEEGFLPVLPSAEICPLSLQHKLKHQFH